MIHDCCPVANNSSGGVSGCWEGYILRPIDHNRGVVGLRETDGAVDDVIEHPVHSAQLRISGRAETLRWRVAANHLANTCIETYGTMTLPPFRVMHCQQNSLVEKQIVGHQFHSVPRKV